MQENQLHGLYREFTDEERKIAEENLDRYLELAWEICEEMRGRESPD